MQNFQVRGAQPGWSNAASAQRERGDECARQTELSPATPDAGRTRASASPLSPRSTPDLPSPGLQVPRSSLSLSERLAVGGSPSCEAAAPRSVALAAPDAVANAFPAFAGQAASSWNDWVELEGVRIADRDFIRSTRAQVQDDVLSQQGQAEVDAQSRRFAAFARYLHATYAMAPTLRQFLTSFTLSGGSFQGNDYVRCFEELTPPGPGDPTLTAAAAAFVDENAARDRRHCGIDVFDKATIRESVQPLLSRDGFKTRVQFTSYAVTLQKLSHFLHDNNALQETGRPSKLLALVDAFVENADACLNNPWVQGRREMAVTARFETLLMDPGIAMDWLARPARLARGAELVAQFRGENLTDEAQRHADHVTALAQFLDACAGRDGLTTLLQQIQHHCATGSRCIDDDPVLALFMQSDSWPEDARKGIATALRQLVAWYRSRGLQ